LENRKRGGGGKASKKVKRNSRSASVQADAIEENGNLTQGVLCTFCKGKFSDDVPGERDGCNSTSVRTGALTNVQRHTRTNLYVITKWI
jgi:hypothetical protein